MGPFAHCLSPPIVRRSRSTVGLGRYTMPRMKRIASAALWFYALWYLGSMISAFLGVPDLLGPILGISGGLIVGVDPRHLLWPATPRAGWSPA